MRRVDGFRSGSRFPRVVRRLAGAALAVTAGWLATLPPAGCSDDRECSSAADCDDGVWCNGAETCSRTGRCYAVPVGPCDDGLACNTDTCDEAARTCAHVVHDEDGDTFGAADCGGDDCDDELAAVHPGATELCNGLDDDCDGTIPEDRDHDRHFDPTVCPGEGDDCDDGDPDRYPGAVEVCDGVDNNCVGGTADERDTDGDTAVDATCTGGTDCDDEDALVHPDADEICNGADDDCDTTTDETFPCRRGESAACWTRCGSAGTGTCTDECALPAGAACEPGDEVCRNFADDDCDGETDEGCPIPDGGCAAGAVECCGDGSDDDCDTETDESDCRPHGACASGTLRHCDAGTEWGWGLQRCPASGDAWGACTEDAPAPGCGLTGVVGWDPNCCNLSGACCEDTWDADADGRTTDSYGLGCTAPEPDCP